MNAVWYQSSNELDEEVRTLIELCTKDYPFLSREYFSAYESTVLERQSKTPRFLVVRDQEAVFAVLPVIEEKKWGWLLLHSLTNYYFFRFDLFLKPDMDDERRYSVYRALKNELDCYRLLQFVPVHEGDSNIRDFLSWVALEGWEVDAYDYTINWTCHIRDMDSYYSQLPSRLRNTLQRAQKKIANRNYQLKLLSDPEKLQEAFPDYWRVYGSSWKVPEPYPEFIERVATAYTKSFRGVLGLLYVDGIPVSAQLWFVKDDTAFIYKLAYDPGYQKLSVGSYLTWELVKYVQAHFGITKLDFLNGDDSYKTDWMDTSESVKGYFCINRKGLIGRLLAVLYRFRNKDRHEERH